MIMDIKELLDKMSLKEKLYQLEQFDSNVILYDKNNGKLMSTIPYEYYSSTEESIPFVDTTLNSAVVISCINNIFTIFAFKIKI